ncbi:MAG: hypothetical protein ABIQ31_15300 [Ferruginibacter sp.]
MDGYFYNDGYKPHIANEKNLFIVQERRIIFGETEAGYWILGYWDTGYWDAGYWDAVRGYMDTGYLYWL